MLSFRGLSPQHCLFSSPSASFPCLSFLFFPCWLLPPGSCSPTSANTIFTHTLYKDFDLNVLCLHHKLKQEPSRLFLLHTLWLQSNSAYPHQEISLNKYLFRYVSVRDRETTDSPTNANSGWVCWKPAGSQELNPGPSCGCGKDPATGAITWRLTGWTLAES